MIQLLSVTEAAAKLGCSPSLIRRVCSDGTVPAMRVGKSYRVNLVDLESWARRQPPAKVVSAPRDASGPDADLLAEIEAWQSYLLHVRGLAPTTVRTHQKHLRCYLKRTAMLKDLATDAASLFRRATLIAVFSAIPAKSYALKLNIYNALLSLGRFLIAEGRLDEAALADVKPLKPRRQVEPRRTHLKAPDVPRLFDVILTRPHPPAENATLAAMMGVMVYAGLRISEVINMRAQDVDLDARVILVHHGKGGKNRRVGISNSLYPYLEAYGRVRPPGGNAYFVRQDGVPWDQDRLTKRMQQFAARLGVDITCHGLRRTFATLAANQGRSVNAIRIALGHANLETTQAYLRTSEAEVVREMANW